MKCIGVKEVKAKPMTRLEYNQYRGWELPADENGADEGFMVEYLDGGQQNHPDHEGYISWSPKEVFERAYRPVDGMTFGLAIEAAKKGNKIARAGWNGKGMFVVYMPPLYLPPFNTEDTARKVNDRTAKWIGEDTPLDCQPYFAMYNAQKQWIPGWLASQSDMLAEDWQVVE
jgi:hypothetical protein